MLNGYSGFDLSIQKNSKGYVFNKETNKEVNRLLEQSKKQEQYAEELQKTPLSYIFGIPEVKTRTATGFSMQYIHGLTPIELFEKGDHNRIDFILNSLFDLITWEQKKCTMARWKYNDFKKKLRTIPIKEPYFSKIKELAKNEKEIPIGSCHGDLTLSNVLYADKIYLVDLHDPFIETPLQDIGKLLQEVDLHWSLHMAKRIGDLPKIYIAYDYLKQKTYDEIEKFAQQNNIDRDIIFLFHLMTIYRLLAYTKEKTMEEEITKQLEELIKNEKKLTTSYSWRK